MKQGFVHYGITWHFLVYSFPCYNNSTLCNFHCSIIYYIWQKILSFFIRVREVRKNNSTPYITSHSQKKKKLKKIGKIQKKFLQSDSCFMGCNCLALSKHWCIICVGSWKIYRNTWIKTFNQLEEKNIAKRICPTYNFIIEFRNQLFFSRGKCRFCLEKLQKVIKCNLQKKKITTQTFFNSETKHQKKLNTKCRH